MIDRGMRHFVGKLSRVVGSILENGWIYQYSRNHNIVSYNQPMFLNKFHSIRFSEYYFLTSLKNGAIDN